MKTDLERFGLRLKNRLCMEMLNIRGWDELRLWNDRYLLFHPRNPPRDNNPQTRHSSEST